MNEIKHDERCNEEYENLRNAIVGQAAKDYISALRAQAKNPDNIFTQAKVEECERYFRSKGHNNICSIDGEYMIEQCRERAKVSKNVFKPRQV